MTQQKPKLFRDANGRLYRWAANGPDYRPGASIRRCNEDGDIIPRIRQKRRHRIADRRSRLQSKAVCP